MFLLSSLVHSMMMVMKSRSSGCFLFRLLPRVWRRTRWMAALLSTIHRNLQRWRVFHVFARFVSSSKADAYPQSSLLVEDDVSRGPSTGPEHV